MTNFHDVYLLMMCVYHCLGLQSVAQYYMTMENHNIPENEKLLTVRIKTRIMFLDSHNQVFEIFYKQANTLFI